MMTCNKCGTASPNGARFCLACGTPWVSTAYSGFWQRVAASILDGIIISFGAAILFAGANIVGGLASLFLPWIYEAAMLSSKKQATVGKLVMGIIVTNTDGNPISFARATGRHFAKYLSCLILGIGFIMVAFTPRKQALHDMISDTLVLREPAR